MMSTAEEGSLTKIIRVIYPPYESKKRFERALREFYISPKLRKYLEAGVKYSLIVKAMHLYGIDLSLRALKELEVDKTLKRPSSVAEIAYYHDIEHTELLKTILDLLSVYGILMRSGGRYLLNPLRREWKVRYPQKILEIVEKPLYKEIFDTLNFFGEQLVDVLLSGEPILDYDKDAITAIEPINLSLPFTIFRLWAIQEGFYALYIRKLRKKKSAKILVFNSEAGYAIQNIFDFFKDWDLEAYVIDSSSRQAKLAETLINERGYNAHVLVYEYTKDIRKISEIADAVETGGFDAAFIFNLWYWIEPNDREKVLANISSVLKPEGIAIDLSFVRKAEDQPYGWEPAFYVVNRWVGIPYYETRRKLFMIYFERIKEKRNSQVIKAEAPVEREVIIK